MCVFEYNMLDDLKIISFENDGDDDGLFMETN